MNEQSWTERIRARRELAAETRDGDAPPADRLCAPEPQPCVHCAKPTREVFFDLTTRRPHARCRGACRPPDALADTTAPPSVVGRVKH
jgi:hypothetical protein